LSSILAHILFLYVYNHIDKIEFTPYHLYLPGEESPHPFVFFYISKDRFNDVLPQFVGFVCSVSCHFCCHGISLHLMGEHLQVPDTVPGLRAVSLFSAGQTCFSFIVPYHLVFLTVKAFSNKSRWLAYRAEVLIMFLNVDEVLFIVGVFCFTVIIIRYIPVYPVIPLNPGSSC
jgi:hypothetical protein